MSNNSEILTIQHLVTVAPRPEVLLFQVRRFISETGISQGHVQSVCTLTVVVFLATCPPLHQLLQLQSLRKERRGSWWPSTNRWRKYPYGTLLL